MERLGRLKVSRVVSRGGLCDGVCIDPMTDSNYCGSQNEERDGGDNVHWMKRFVKESGNVIRGKQSVLDIYFINVTGMTIG